MLRTLKIFCTAEKDLLKPTFKTVAERVNLFRLCREKHITKKEKEKKQKMSQISPNLPISA